MLARCQSKTSRTQWWHQGCGYGNTWDHIALASCTQGDNARRTAAEGY